MGLNFRALPAEDIFKADCSLLNSGNSLTIYMILSSISIFFYFHFITMFSLCVCVSRHVHTYVQRGSV